MSKEMICFLNDYRKRTEPTSDTLKLSRHGVVTDRGSLSVI